MNKILESSKSNVEKSMKDAVGYASTDQKHREQEGHAILDTDKYFAGFDRESKAQKNIRRDSLRAREDLNDFNVDSTL